MTNEELNAIRQVIKEELQPVKDDVTGLKQDVADLKQDVAGLTKTVEEHSKKIDRLELNLHYTFEAVKDVARDLRESRTDIKEMKETIKNVENAQEQIERRLLQNQADVITALQRTREIKHEMTRYDEIIATLEARFANPPSAG